MAQSWEFAGVDLNTYAWDVRLLGGPIGTPPRRGDNVVLPGRPGRLHVAKNLEQRSVTLAMFVRDVHPTSGSLTGSEAQMLANLDALKGAFATDGQATLRHTHGGVTRVALAEVVSAVEFQPKGPNNLYSFVVEFLLADPLWYAESATTVGPTTVTVSGQNIAVQNDGSYKCVDAVVTIEGVITDPKVAIGSIWVEYAGAVGSGETLVIDCGSWTAELDGVDVSGSISHDGAVAWLEVAPGANTATVTGTIGTPNPTVEFEFTEGFV